MSVRYKVGDNELPHFITFSVIEFIDALTRTEYKNIIVDSLQYCIEHKGLRLHAWVIMTNHVHFILSSKNDCMIPGILRDFKKFTSKKIIDAIKTNNRESRKEWLIYMFKRAGKRNSNNKYFQFWEQDSHPVELSIPNMLRQRIDYLHENPVKTGVVYEPQQYIYSSAIDYYTTFKGLIEIEHLHT